MMRATDLSTHGPMAPSIAAARASGGSSTPVPYGCMERTPSTDGLRMPAEWSPHERTLLAWPARRHLWGERYEYACTAHAAVADAVADHEPVTMVAAPGDAAAARFECGPRVEVVSIPIDDSWIRDTGPIGVV